jgi:hypothetical protein
MRQSLGVILLFVLGSAQAALIDRGGGLIYDDDLDITWLQDANLAASNTFGLPIGVSLGTYPSDSSGVLGIITLDGGMNWPAARFWIDAMNAANYLGVSDWRLPTTIQPDPTCNYQLYDPPQGSGGNCTGSEMGHLLNIEGVNAPFPGLFSNVQSFYYWSSTEWAPGPVNQAWNMYVAGDGQFGGNKINNYYVFAVHDGDVVVAVTIDVDPWSTDNIIKPNSDYPIAVAILGSSEFDVIQIDPATVKLAEATNTMLVPEFGNFDNDEGDITDALLGFATEDTGIACDDIEVTLTGQTYSGVAFEGADTINAADCTELMCHP